MEEAKRVGCLAGPMVAISLSQYLQQVISLMMVGDLGELALSSAAIATSLAGVTGTRVANELGAGRPHAARIAVCVALSLTAMDSIIVSSTMFGIHHAFGYAYSNEKEVVDYVADMTPLIFISVLMDNVQGVLSGVARGCGWQLLGALVTPRFGSPVNRPGNATGDRTVR